jgi:hypothetical protein
MGDHLEDDIFELEDKINSYGNDGSNSDDESLNSEEEDVEEDEEKIKKQLKTAKKKRKFEEMKSKKKAKLEQADSEAAEPTIAQTPEAQAILFRSLVPGNMDGSKYDEDNFFSYGVSDGMKNHHMAAVMAGMPSFRTALHESGEPGAPLVVIVCSSARRAATVINTISPHAKCKVGKMFAKHFKVQDQVVALRAHFPIVVGTPNRLAKLVEMGAMSLVHTHIVLIDMAKDTKQFSVLSLPGVCEDLYSFMCGPVETELAHIKVALVHDGSLA